LSPCNLFWFLLSREQEIRNLRLVLKTIADGTPAEDVRDFLAVPA